MAAPEICPNCGADVPPNAKACPECGSSEETGWSEAARTSGLGLPDEDFKYNEFLAEEFGKKRRLRHGAGWFWCIIAVLVIAMLLMMIFWWK